MNDDDDEGDGQALMSTKHPITATQEMIMAGVEAHRQAWEVKCLSPEKIVAAVYEAMAEAAPWPEDISEDAIEDMPVPQAMVDAEIERLAKAIAVADGCDLAIVWEPNDHAHMQARYRRMATAVVEATWGKSP